MYCAVHVPLKASCSLGVCLGFCAILAVGRPDARAQDAPADPTADKLKKLTLEDLMQVQIPTVFSASMHEQKVTEAPSSVSIVTAEDVKQ